MACRLYRRKAGRQGAECVPNRKIYRRLYTGPGCRLSGGGVAYGRVPEGYE